MKNYPNPSFVLLSLILLILAGCADPQKKIDAVNALPKTTIEITETLFEFGIVQQGDRIKHSFVFKNTGTQPLVIGHVKTSCSCTSSDWSNEPVAPGAEAIVTLDLNTSDKEGGISKGALVFMNTEEEKVRVMMKGTVETGK